MNGQPILSQFPNTHSPHGDNLEFDWFNTVKAEGRPPDQVFRAHVPNDAAFDKAAQDLRDRPFWDWNPGPNETNCSTAAHSALNAGGHHMGWGSGKLPDFMLNDLLEQVTYGNPGTRALPQVPW
jgi:hypothetical protein